MKHLARLNHLNLIVNNALTSFHAETVILECPKNREIKSFCNSSSLLLQWGLTGLTRVPGDAEFIGKIQLYVQLPLEIMQQILYLIKQYLACCPLSSQTCLIRS